MPRYKVEKHFKVSGYECVIIGTNAGTRCGYVAIPKSHVLYGKSFFDINKEYKFDVHGRLTYSDMQGDYPIKNDKNYWWIGFDCCHSFDGKDYKLMRELTTDVEYDFFMQFERGFTTNAPVRTTKYVEEQLRSLVKQIKNIAK